MTSPRSASRAGLPAGGAPASERGRLRQEGIWLLEILGLSGFAATQPILDLFGKSAETFVFKGAGPAEVVLFALVVTLVPPLTLWVLALCARPFGLRARQGVQLGILGLLCSVIAIQVLKKSAPLLGLPLILLAVALGAASTTFLARSRAGRLWLRYAAVGPIVFLAAFLLASPTAALLRTPALADPPPSSPAGDTPVVFLLFDEFPLMTLLEPNGEIDEKLFPNFAALARRATWYRNFTTTEPATRFAVPTLLTGRLATDRGRYALAASYPDNLFTLLRDSHELAVFERHSRLCPPEICPESPAADDQAAGEMEAESGDDGVTVLVEAPTEAVATPRFLEGSRARAVVHLLRDAVDLWTDLSFPREVTRDAMGQFAEDLPEAPTNGGPESSMLRLSNRFADFLRSLEANDGKPGLYFAHLMLPHSPWRLYPSGIAYIDETLSRVEERPGTIATGAPERRREERWLLDLMRQRHLLQAQYVDRLVGELVRRLETLGIYDQTLLVITADHGLSVYPGREIRNAQWENLHEILWVPLFVKRPGQRVGENDVSNLMSIDLVPTIAEILGQEIPWEVDGFPAADPRIERRVGKVVGGYHFLAGPFAHSLYVVPGEEVEAARRRLPAEVFRPADPQANVQWWPYLVGPGAQLIGRQLDELEMAPPAEGRATLRRPALERFREVDLDRGPLPAFLLGALEGVDGPLDARVAVALNGRIGGVSEVFSLGRDHGLFSVLIPDFLFVAGANELELFHLDGEALHPLRFD